MPLRLWAPIDGRCPPQSMTVYRVYNGRWRENDSNHRFTAKRGIVDAMVAAGWTDEGAAMCVPQ